MVLELPGPGPGFNTQISGEAKEDNNLWPYLEPHSGLDCLDRNML